MRAQQVVDSLWGCLDPKNSTPLLYHYVIKCIFRLIYFVMSKESPQIFEPRIELDLTEKELAIIIKYLLPFILAALLPSGQGATIARAQIWPNNLRPGAGPLALPNPSDKSEPWYNQQPDSPPLPKPDPKLKVIIGAYLGEAEMNVRDFITPGQAPFPTAKTRRVMAIKRNQQAWDDYREREILRAKEKASNMIDSLQNWGQTFVR